MADENTQVNDLFGLIGKLYGDRSIKEDAIHAAKVLYENMDELSKAIVYFAVNTGLRGTALNDYKKVLKSVKGNNRGEESYLEIAKTMAEIVKVMGKMDNIDLKNITESVLIVQRYLKVDTVDALLAVKKMMETMGVTATQAFDFLAVGSQNGLNFYGDLAKIVEGNCSLWQQTGLSLEQVFTILDNGLNAGAGGLGEITGYVKEFHDSLINGGIEETIGGFSAQTQSLFDSWKSGNGLASDVFYSMISDLENMEDKQAQLALASSIWSSGSSEDAMRVLFSLNDVNNAYENLDGTMERIKKAEAESVEAQVTGFKNKAEEIIVTPIADAFSPIVAGAVQIGTDLLNEIDTTIIRPERMELEAYTADAKEARKVIDDILSENSTKILDTKEQTKHLDELIKQALELNSISGKTDLQKMRMDETVKELGQMIPEISQAYDTQTGKIELTNNAIKELAKSKKKLMTDSAEKTALAAEQQAYTEYWKTLNNVQMAEKALREEQEYWDGLHVGLLEIDMDLKDGNNITEKLKEVKTSLEDAKNTGKISVEEYEAAITELERSGSDIAFILQYVEERLGTYTLAEVGAKTETDNLSESIENCGKSIVAHGGVIPTVTDALDQNTEAMNQNADASEQNADATGQTAEAAEQNAKAQKEESEALEENSEQTDANIQSQEVLSQKQTEVSESSQESTEALDEQTYALLENIKAAQNVAVVQEQAAQSVRSTFDSVKSGIESDLQGKLSLFDMFDREDGGADLSVEDMTENLDSQIEAFDNYQKNLEAVKEHVGKEISPEFMRYLEDMGLEGANTLEHILQTFADEEPEKVKELSDKWGQAMNQTEQIANAGAANAAAYAASIGEFGSSEEEFSELSAAVDAAVSSVASGWQKLPEDTESALREAIRVAKECGIAIPEGLTEGIGSGVLLPEVAIAQLNGSLQGTFNGLVEAAQEAGIEVPPNLAEGIAGGGQEAIDAYKALIALILSNGSASGMDTTGSDITSMIGNGIESGGAGVIEQVKGVVNGALTAAGSDLGSWLGAGMSMAGGVALGIGMGASGAIAAAASMAAMALAAAKAVLKIASPSKVFRNDVGARISEGFAFGISDKAALAGKEAAKMSNKIYTEGTKWLSKYKRSHQVSLEEERWYWQQVVKHTKEGSAARKKAEAKIQKAAAAELKGAGFSTKAASKTATKIQSNFGVSEKDGKKKKSAATYYSEVYSAAEKYASNQQILNDWSLSQELSYWSAVTGQLKKGTQAWYDATKRTKDLQEKIKEEEARAAQERIKTHQNVQKDILDKYKVYYKVSAKAEADYWNIARQQFKQGTDERIQADQKYLNALEDWYKERKDLDEDYAKNSQDINERLTEDVKNLQDTYRDAVESRKKDILSSMNLFEAWDAEGYTADALLYNLKTQVAGLALWEQQLEELGRKGLASELMEELREMGPDAAANIYSLNQMTAEQLDEYNRLWEQKGALAQSQALKENAPLLADTNKQISELRAEAQAELSALNADYRAALEELNAGISGDLRSLINKAGSIGEDTVSGLIAGIGKAVDSVEVYNSTTRVVDYVSGQLGALQQEGMVIGQNTLNQILDGMTDYTKIDTASRQMVQSIRRAVEEETGRSLQQAALQAQVEQLDVSGIARLNQLTEYDSRQETIVNIDNHEILSVMQQMLDGMWGMVDEMKGLQVVMYPDVVAGELQPIMSQENAAAAVRKSRGRY
ncbi:hypothetical protein D7Y05_02280 [bacterium 1XD42-54]|nr:hypothetical protein D7Y05_02280 [bacterium 1XD42-54]